MRKSTSTHQESMTRVKRNCLVSIFGETFKKLIKSLPLAPNLIFNTCLWKLNKELILEKILIYKFLYNNKIELLPFSNYKKLIFGKGFNVYTPIWNFKPFDQYLKINFLKGFKNYTLFQKSKINRHVIFILFSRKNWRDFVVSKINIFL